MPRLPDGLRYCLCIRPNTTFLAFSPGIIQHRTITTPRTSNHGVRTTNPKNSNAERSSDSIGSLPEPEDVGKAIKITAGDREGVKLDFLGPMVVNRDGTLSRISNWAQMTHMEQQNTLRILGKRNKLRVEALKTGDDTKPPAK